MFPDDFLSSTVNTAGNNISRLFENLFGDSPSIDAPEPREPLYPVNNPLVPSFQTDSPGLAPFAPAMVRANPAMRAIGDYNQRNPLVPPMSAPTQMRARQPSQAGATAQGQLDYSSRENYVRSAYQVAKQVEESTGIPAELMVAITLNERGVNPDPDHVLFGIKAGGDWKGRVHRSPTWEVYNGQRVDITDDFRAYDTPGEAFADFANLIMNSPRYQPALAAQTADDFVRRIHRAGYATDPAWSDKIIRLMREIRGQ